MRPRDPNSNQSRIRAYINAHGGRPVRYAEMVRELGLTKEQVWGASTDLVRFKCAERVKPHAIRAISS